MSPTSPLTSLDRELAVEAVERLCRRPRWAAMLQAAEDDFLAPLRAAAAAGSTGDPDFPPQAALAAALAHSNLQRCLRTHLLADLQLDRGRSGATLVLESDKAAAIPFGARRYLRALAASRLALYEVVDRVWNESLSLRELPEGRELRVVDRHVSRQLRPGDTMAARVLEPEAAPPALHEALHLPQPAAWLRVHLRPPAGTEAAGLALLWFEGTFLNDPRQVPCRRNGESDESATVVLRLPAGSSPTSWDSACDASVELRRHKATPRIDDAGPPGGARRHPTWTARWTSPVGPALAGILQRADGEIVLCATCPGSLARLEELARALAPPGTAEATRERIANGRAWPGRDHRVELHFELESALLPDDLDPTAPDAESRAVRASMEFFYRQWAEQPIRFLGDRSPREAARLAAADPALRTRLAELVEALERTEDERWREEPLARPDLAWMREWGRPPHPA